MLENSLNHLKLKIAKVAFKSKEGHIASAYSILDILYVLYDKVLKFEDEKNKDTFILSKGHASLGLYAVLLEKGLLTEEEFNSFCQFDSILGGHADATKIPAATASTGSLGHGLSMSIGVALGYKIKNSNASVYCLVGDGECNEGTIWEAALLAGHHCLNNLVCFVDYNHSTDRALLMHNIEDKFRSFGWNGVTLDGHDQEAIYQAILDRPKNAPFVIVANTIKGKGVHFMESNPEWHHKTPSLDELYMIEGELVK
ncbi:transketolase [Pigmentibacter ruber]